MTEPHDRATSIQAHQSVTNGKHCIQDLSTWRSSDKYLKGVETASALTYSQWFSSSISPLSANKSGVSNEVLTLSFAQSITASVIAKDLNTKVDELQLRMNTLKMFSNHTLVKHELDKIESIIDQYQKEQQKADYYRHVKAIHLQSFSWSISCLSMLSII